MIRPLALTLTLTLTLAACGGPENNAATAPAEPAANGTDYVEAIRTMPDGQRHATMLRAIRDASQDCQQVTQSAEGQPVNGRPAWMATCEDGRSWTVVVAPDGNATVTNAPDPAAAMDTAR